MIIVVAIVGNKIDLITEKEEEVEEEDARNYAESKGAFFCLTSALDKNGIDRLFKEIGLKLLKNNKNNNKKEDKNKITKIKKDNSKDNKKQGKCC